MSSAFLGTNSLVWNRIPLRAVAAWILLLPSWDGAATATSGVIAGYAYGQPIPVTCLNRTIDSGEHITDNLGNLQYIPFPTCNETSRPLALRYGITETVTCTISSLSDTQYHLLEYYVHSDVPLTCRVPSAPLGVSWDGGEGPARQSRDDDTQAIASLDPAADARQPYTPITFALQGTHQKSHLHIWTEMNVLVHKIASAARTPKRKHADRAPGYIVAGTAYSVPEFEMRSAPPHDQAENGSGSNKPTTKEDEAAAVARAAREPWTAGHGTKVVRGEPLTFSFHVAWLEGGRAIWWPARTAGWAFESTASSSRAGALFARLVFFVMAASVGAVVALGWQRRGGRGRGQGGWRGDGILGAPGLGVGKPRSSNGMVSYGNLAAGNGYGGYAAHGSVSSEAGEGGAGYGYGGYSSGKTD